MKALLCGTSDVHYSLRPMLWSCPSNIDPSSRLDQRLRKVSVSADSGAKVGVMGVGWGCFVDRLWLGWRGWRSLLVILFLWIKGLTLLVPSTKV